MKRWIAAGCGLLLVIALGYWRFNPGKPSQRPNDASTPAAPETTPLGLAPASPASLAEMQRQWTNLPPSGAPLSLIHDELQRRAAAGDAPAACRLGAELVRCGTLRALTDETSLALADADLQSIEREEGPDSARQSGASTLSLIEQSKSCAGITDEQLRQTNRYLRQAALAGIPEAAMRYAEGQGLSMVNVLNRGMFGFLRDPGLAAWQREAVPLVEQQLRLGNPAATLTLMSAYGEDHTLFGGLVEKDPELAYRYEILFKTVLASKVKAHPRKGLAPEAALRAMQDAERMYQQYFGGRPGAKDAFQQISPLPMKETDATKPHCAPASRTGQS